MQRTHWKKDVLYIKSKVALAEAHLTRSPKLYFEKFNTKNDPEINIEILDYLVTRESPVYAELPRKCWVLSVLEITKILSKSKGEKFGIGKLYNKLLNKEFKEPGTKVYIIDRYAWMCYSP